MAVDPGWVPDLQILEGQFALGRMCRLVGERGRGPGSRVEEKGKDWCVFVGCFRETRMVPPGDQCLPECFENGPVGAWTGPATFERYFYGFEDEATCKTFKDQNIFEIGDFEYHTHSCYGVNNNTRDGERRPVMASAAP